MAAMAKAREFLEKTSTSEEADKVSRLTFPPHQAHPETSFYEYFILRGIRVDLVQPGSISCSFKVPPRLTDRNGKLAMGAIASLIDEIGAAVVNQDGQPMDVSVDMSISYISAAKMNVSPPHAIFNFPDIQTCKLLSDSSGVGLG